jgi:uncharacterized protein YbjT (DUF2867 family)
LAATTTVRPILVTGAAGKTGLAVIRGLAAVQVPVRAFVRRQAQREQVERPGAQEVVVGDLRSRETVAEAVDGVAAIYHICPNVHPDETGIGRRVVAAAIDAGVGRLVYHSVLHPQAEAMPHHWAKLRVEELLFESGLDTTILQPAPYMQNVLANWSAIAEQSVYPVPYSLDSRVVMVDLLDVAEAAVRVLTEPGHVGATYELCGPDLLDQQEIAAALGRALERTVRPVTVPVRRWAEQARGAGLGERQVDTLCRMFRYYDSFGMAGSPRVLEGLIGRPPGSFEAFVARIVGAQPRPPRDKSR